MGRWVVSTEEIIGMQVSVLQVHDWQWMCQTLQVPGEGGKNMNLFLFCLVNNMSELEQTQQRRYVTMLHTNDSHNTSIDIYTEMSLMEKRKEIHLVLLLRACIFQYGFNDISYFSEKEIKLSSGLWRVQRRKQSKVQCTLQSGKINTTICKARPRGYKGIHLVTLSHKPAGYVLFLPWDEFLSHLGRARGTAAMIKAALLNCIVVCSTLLCVKPTSKDALWKWRLYQCKATVTSISNSNALQRCWTSPHYRLLSDEALSATWCRGN